MRIKLLFSFLIVLFFSQGTFAQKATVTLTLDEKFFEELFSVVFKDGGVLEFPLDDSAAQQSPTTRASAASTLSSSCAEVVRLTRPPVGKPRSVRLNDGRIIAPIAFTGRYNPPLFPCFDYSGTANAEIVLEFDKKSQSLNGIVRARDMSLSGTPGVVSGIVSRLVQRSIDKRVNPIQIIGLEMVSMNIPVQGAAEVSMRAVEVKHKIEKGQLILNITYEFIRK
jgi:hypothetical protein